MFLKSCAYGTMGGAALGLASLALVDKPSEHTANVARGASLGLYAGIAYGWYQLQNEDSSDNYLQARQELNAVNDFPLVSFLVADPNNKKITPGVQLQFSF
ncbi:MAG: hypothetical protein ACLGGX_06940 [Bdellovibrionia bacterium]